MKPRDFYEAVKQMRKAQKSIRDTHILPEEKIIDDEIERVEKILSEQTRLVSATQQMFPKLDLRQVK